MKRRERKKMYEIIKGADVEGFTKVGHRYQRDVQAELRK